ncbi:MAG TPA: hypothetical protein VEC95_07785, partial [Terriglobales bacterium]|nr:hypothetical protein [Terriglobales bacterium]
MTLFALVMLSHDTPYDCLKDGVTVLVFAAMGAAAALVPIIVTSNDPMWRVLGIALFTLIATFIYRTSNFPIGGIPFGIVAYMGTAIWERRMPAEKLLHLALWPVGALAVGVGCVVAVDCVFNQSDPARALRQEIGARLRAMEQLLRLHLANADSEQIGKQAALVRRYAVTG